jgi:hypothetical protein
LKRLSLVAEAVGPVEHIEIVRHGWGHGGWECVRDTEEEWDRKRDRC